MSTMNVLGAGPAPAKGAAARTSPAGAPDEFAALLAGLVSELAPAVVPATAETVPAGNHPTTLGADPNAVAPLPLFPGGSAATPAAPAAVLPASATAAATAPAPAAVTAPLPVAAAVSGPPASAVPPAPVDSAPAAAQAPGQPTPVAAPPVPTGPEAAAPVPTATSAAATPTLSSPSTMQGSPAAEAEAAPTPAPSAQEVLPDGGDERPAAPTPAPAAPTEASRVLTPVPAEGAGAAPVAETRVVSTPVAPAPAAPAAPTAPPATQVVQQLAPVLAGPDGSYTMSLKLYPEELGAVQVEVSLRGGEISVALHAADDVSRELLRGALAELRAQLEAGGLTATDLSVDSGKADDPREQPAAQRPRTSSDAGDGDGESPASAPAPDPDAALDLRM